MDNEPVIQLPAELRERCDRVMIDSLRKAVQAVKTRNDILRSYHDQLDRISSVAMGPWDKSCQLDDPITTRHHLGLQAHFMAGLKYEPYWHIESEKPEQEEAASKVESALTVKTRQWKVRTALMDATYDAPAYPYAPMYVGWDVQWKKRRFWQYLDPVTGERLDETLLQPDVKYKKIPTVQKYQSFNGPIFRQIDPCDYGYYPAACQDIDACDFVWERMYLTRNDLLEGMDKKLYEESGVMDMLGKGCQYVDADSIRSDQDVSDGIQVDSEDGYYEVYQIVGRLPLLLDYMGAGEEGGKLGIGIPEELRFEDWVFMICPEYNCVFRCVPSPFDMRPYAVFQMWHDPRRLMGKCVPQLLETHQAEADANLRFFIDCLNLTASPMWKVPESYARKGSSLSAGPGKHIQYPGNNPNAIEPVVWDNHILPLVQGAQVDMRQQADSLLGAAGTNDLPQPGQESPTATQVNMVGGQVDHKRDLFLQTFLDFGMERMGQLLLSHWQQHMDPEGETLAAGGSSVDITAADLQNQYRVLAHANTDASNPQVRLAQVQLKQQFQMAYFQGLAQLPPDKWGMLYHGARRAYEETGERNIEGWIGKEPQAGDPVQVLMMALQMLTQAASAGDMAAPQIIQAIAQAMQGDQQMAGPAEGNVAMQQPAQQEAA